MRTVLMALCWLMAWCALGQEVAHEKTQTKPSICVEEGSVAYRPYFDAPSRALFFIAGPASKKSLLDGKINMFVCGALQSPDTMTPLLGRKAPFVPAVAQGFWQTSIQVDGKRIPMMTATDRQHLLTGVVWLNVTEREVQSIEKFELAGNLRKRITIDVHVGDRVIKAITYVKR